MDQTGKVESVSFGNLARAVFVFYLFGSDVRVCLRWFEQLLDSLIAIGQPFAFTPKYFYLVTRGIIGG